MKGFTRQTRKAKCRALKRARQRVIPLPSPFPYERRPDAEPARCAYLGDPVLGAVFGALSRIRARRLEALR